MSPAEAIGATVTAAAVLAEATSRLRASGSPSARLDAEVLLAHALDRDRGWLAAHLDVPVPDAIQTTVDAWVARRSRGEPVAYIRRFKEWYGLRIITDRRALIPRPETEQLVDAAIGEIADRMARDQEPILAWDVGTGSGAIAVALGRRFRSALTLGRLRLVARDQSPEALELAAENLAAHGVDRLVSLALADLVEPIGADPDRPDVVIANLPYVPSAIVAAREGSLGWEPAGALDGGDDGLDVVRRLLYSLPGRMAARGTALLEIGTGQAVEVQATVEGLAGDWSASTFPDLAGHPRIVRMVRGG